MSQATLPRAFWSAAPTRLRQGVLGPLGRAAQGDAGPGAVFLGLLAIWGIFQAANSNFLTPLNLTNLLVQIAATGTVSVGVVLVLLIGEIDLSVGWVSGLSAAVTAVLATKFGVPGPAAILGGLATGAAIGLLQGAWITKLRVPSFIVTLAGLLAWQGALIQVLGETGTVNLTDPVLTGIANQRIPGLMGIALGIVAVGTYAVATLWGRARRARAGMLAPSTARVTVRVILVAAAVFGAVTLMSVNRSPNPAQPVEGIPSGVLAFLGFVVLFDLLTRRTRFGRYVYAVGGNAEAARRTGIDVDRVRIAVFVLSSTLAASGGILAASRLYAVNQSSGGGDVLLAAIAAPVIAGTSLFGGRGNVWSVVLGALVIGSISNGMDLLALASSIKFMITGAVLLVAVTVEALARASREAAGRMPDRPSAAAHPASDRALALLTPREREVAALIARGRTNRQIADELVITERTAGAHVEHILTKLGFQSRAQVAAWVVEHQLGGAEERSTGGGSRLRA